MNVGSATALTEHYQTAFGTIKTAGTGIKDMSLVKPTESTVLVDHVCKVGAI